MNENKDVKVELKTGVFSECKYCRRKAKLTACDFCGVGSLMNKHPEVFQETVIERLEPKIDRLQEEFEILKQELRELKIIKLRRKAK